MLTFSNASKEGSGGFAVQFSDKVPRGCWSSADCMKSSTFRKVKATRLVLESYYDQTDNRNAE